MIYTRKLWHLRPKYTGPSKRRPPREKSLVLRQVRDVSRETIHFWIPQTQTSGTSATSEEFVSSRKRSELRSGRTDFSYTSPESSGGADGNR